MCVGDGSWGEKEETDRSDVYSGVGGTYSDREGERTRKKGRRQTKNERAREREREREREGRGGTKIDIWAGRQEMYSQTETQRVTDLSRSARSSTMWSSALLARISFRTDTTSRLCSLAQ